jgi:hypothetical protein
LTFNFISYYCTATKYRPSRGLPTAGTPGIYLAAKKDNFTAENLCRHANNSGCTTVRLSGADAMERGPDMKMAGRGAEPGSTFCAFTFCAFTFSSFSRRLVHEIVRATEAQKVAPPIALPGLFPRFSCDFLLKTAPNCANPRESWRTLENSRVAI